MFLFSLAVCPMVIFMVHGQALDQSKPHQNVPSNGIAVEVEEKNGCVKNYSCYYSACRPKSYDVAKPPSQTKVLGNIGLVENARLVEDIDVHKMKIKLTPKLLLVWYDTRLKYCNLAKEDQLDENLLYMKWIWAPEILHQSGGYGHTSKFVHSQTFEFPKTKEDLSVGI